jgi:hypothetical protein
MRDLFRPLLVPGFTITGFTINRNDLNAEPFASADSKVIVGALKLYPTKSTVAGTAVILMRETGGGRL